MNALFDPGDDHSGVDRASEVSVRACDKRTVIQRLRLAIVSSLAIVITLTAQPGRGQNSINQCIDSCYLQVCSSYETGSSAKQACVNRCLDENCRNQTVNPAPQPTRPRPPKAASWGAIAYSTREMAAGYSQGKDDRASAEQEAMNVCAKRGKECAIRATFNKQCGALAADGAFTGSGISADARQAQQEAIDKCKRAGGKQCVLHVMFCTF